MTIYFRRNLLALKETGVLGVFSIFAGLALVTQSFFILVFSFETNLQYFGPP